ncbi:MAG: hypothetical protein RLZZ488_496 [Pseudomonadota bacterium]|jgi:hypothetical protein
MILQLKMILYYLYYSGLNGNMPALKTVIHKTMLITCGTSLAYLSRRPVYGVVQNMWMRCVLLVDKNRCPFFKRYFMHTNRKLPTGCPPSLAHVIHTAKSKIS